MSTSDQTMAEEPAAKRALIEQILQRRKALSREPLGVQMRPAAIPMSFGQERLWHVEQISVSKGAYNISAGMRFKGRLDVDAMAAGLTTIVARHEALRTRLVVQGAPGEAAEQVVDAPAPVALQPMDVTEDALVGAMTAVAARPLDLERGPLYHFTLFRLAEDDNVLAWVVHHIIADGWSVGVMMRELASLYNAFKAGQPSPLEPLRTRLSVM